MMKTNKFIMILLTFIMLSGVLMSASAEPIDFKVSLAGPGGGVFNPYPGGNPYPKSEPICPQVSQNGYEITFTSSHPVYTLYIVEDDVVVYSVIVSSTTTSVLLPSWLSGDYVLYLQPEGSSYYFYGDITL